MLSYPNNKLVQLNKGDSLWIFLLDNKNSWGRYPESCGHLYGKWTKCTVTWVGNSSLDLMIDDPAAAAFGDWFCIQDVNPSIKNVTEGPFPAMWSFYDPSEVKKPEPKPVYGPQTCKGYQCPDPVNPYAEPNQPDGSFLCYTCRNVWRPKGPEAKKKYDGFPDLGNLITVPS